MQSLEKMDAIVSELTAMHVHVRKPELAIAVQNPDKNCPMSRTKLLISGQIVIHFPINLARKQVRKHARNEDRKQARQEQTKQEVKLESKLECNLES